MTDGNNGKEMAVENVKEILSSTFKTLDFSNMLSVNFVGDLASKQFCIFNSIFEMALE